MTYQEKIIEFMHFKALLIDINSSSLPNYFYHEDEKFILNLNSIVACRIWDKLKFYVCFYRYGREGLSPYSCPYCIIMCNIENRCDYCHYAKLHKKCNSLDDLSLLQDKYDDTPISDWEKITRNLNTDKIFTNIWYKKIINYIDECE